MTEDEAIDEALLKGATRSADRRIIGVLIEFFREEFANDAASVGDWLAQGGDDPDEFMFALERLSLAVRKGKAS